MTTKDISAVATYSVDDPTMVSVTNGVIKALKAGSTKITASYKAPVGDEKQVVINIKVNSFDDWTTLTSATDLNGKTFVIMGAEDNKVFYCPDAQNLAYEDASSVLMETGIVGYQFKAEKITLAGHSNCYLLRLITLRGSEYSIYGKPGYLNSQPVSGGWCSFILGLTKGYGEDVENGAAWDIDYVEGKGVKNSTSGITTIQRERENDVVYNLQGVKIGSQSELKSLPRGIYIIGGKKVVVK